MTTPSHGEKQVAAKVKWRRNIKRHGFRRIDRRGFYRLSTTLITSKSEDVMGQAS